jgi:hypothetical protein
MMATGVIFVLVAMSLFVISWAHTLYCAYRDLKKLEDDR